MRSLQSVQTEGRDPSKLSSPVPNDFGALFDFNTVDPIFDESAAFDHTKALARTLFIAASITQLGHEIGPKRIKADVQLLTDRTLTALKDLGYREEVFTDPRILAFIEKQKNSKRASEPHEIPYIRQCIEGDTKCIGKIYLLPEGRSLWGVSIIPLNPTGDIDLRKCVSTAHEKIASSIESTRDYVIKKESLAEINSMERAILYSVKNYEEALAFTNLDEQFISTMLGRGFPSRLKLVDIHS